MQNLLQANELNSQVCLRKILDLRVAEVGRLSANAKNAFNSFVGCVFASLRQKTLFLPKLPKLQQKSGRQDAIFGLMEKLTVSAARLKNIFSHLFVLCLANEFRPMMSSKRTERGWWWRSSKLASVVSLIHCFPVFPTLSSALQQLNPHLQLFLSNLISFWRLPFSFPSNSCMFNCQKMQKKGQQSINLKPWSDMSRCVVI